MSLSSSISSWTLKFQVNFRQFTSAGRIRQSFAQSSSRFPSVIFIFHFLHKFQLSSHWIGNSIPFRKTCRTIGFTSQRVTSNREGGQRTCFSWDFMVRIQVTIYSTSKLAEEDFVFRLVFFALPPPLRFRRERLLPTFCSSSSPCVYVHIIAILFYLDFRLVVNLSSGTFHYKIIRYTSPFYLRADLFAHIFTSNRLA